MPNNKSDCRLLALILPSLEGVYPADILRGFEKAAGCAGYGVVIAVCADAREEIEKIDRAVACGAAGVSLLPCAGTKLTVQALGKWADEGVYVSVIERNPGFDHVDFVGCDNRGGGFIAAEHMYRAGFSKALFVSDSPQLSTVLDRFVGFIKGCGQFGMKLMNEESEGGKSQDPPICGLDDFAMRFASCKECIPFSLFASNDQTAARAMSILRENVADIGKEIGVIGFGNSALCDYTQPKLTSIAQNGARVGETVAKLAIDKIESGDKQVVRHILPAQLVERKSCAEQ